MPTIYETAQRSGNFSTLLKAVQTAGLEQTLRGPGPYTLFAPSDQAFQKLPEDDVDRLMKDRTRLGEVLKDHLVQGKFSAEEVSKRTEVRTVRGGTFRVSKAEGSVKIGSAKVTTADIQADNGVIHAIDSVIMPRAEGADAPKPAGMPPQAKAEGPAAPKTPDKPEARKDPASR